jgi:hypothetical protein
VLYIIRNKSTRRNKTYPIWLLFCDSPLSSKILASSNIPFLRSCGLTSELSSSSTHHLHSPTASRRESVCSCYFVRILCNVSRAYWLQNTSPTRDFLLVVPSRQLTSYRIASRSNHIPLHSL